MTVTVKHSKTNAISDWTQAQLDEQIELGNFAPGTTLANIVLPSDWNNDHTLTGVGTMAEQDANTVAITGGTATLSSVTTPSVTATTNNLTLSAISTGAVNLATAGGTQFKAIDATSSVNVWNVRGGDGSTTSPRFTTEGTGTNIAGQFNTKGTGALQFFSGNTEQMRISNTASAVNYVQVTGAATGNRPSISAQGSDNPISLDINAKGSAGTVRISNGLSTAFGIFQGVSGQTVVNYPTFIASQTTNAIQTQATGTDTNISMAFQPKGTGAINLAAGSSGVNISNGGTVTAITRTAPGSGYTSIPTTTISPPTTAGGVQAVAYSVIQNSAATIANGGTGYTVGNVLTMVGGTLQTGTAGTFTVSAVSGGVITAVTVLNFGQYNAIPTNPVTVTGGSGSGATLNVSYIYGYAVFTNNGSGYIEQPTVTFSGGGGSGAAAYAVIGNTTITRGLASVSTFHSPSGETLRLSESGGTSVVGLNITNGSSNQNTVYMYPHGSAVNPNTILGSKGTGFVGLFTGSNNDSNGTQQFRVAHTASAVNYVQVTGSATGAAASSLGGLSFTGSDASPNFAIGTKGTGYIAFYGQAATNVQSFRISNTNASSAGNLLQVQGAAAGSAPSISAISGTSGTDANIDITLTPKGTGRLRFGTHTATADTAVSGYIEILDSGGTVRRLAVVS